MTDYDEEIPDSEKARISSSFILHAPPGEFNEVFNDVRTLLNNDTLLRSEEPMRACAKYCTDQLLPVTIDGCKGQVLITNHGKLKNGRFFDPRTKRSFKYDPLKGEVSDVQDDPELENDTEAWRAAVEESFADYITDHYAEGAYTVYGSMVNGSVQVTVCIEDHRYQPQNFWNGRWRSEWQLTVDASSAQIVGILKNQVHYYEDGNVQLVSQKECKDSISVNSEKQVAKDFVKLVSKAETDYQIAISENYSTMSENTFKALRRQLPVTRAKIDWNKILGYKIGKDLGGNK